MKKTLTLRNAKHEDEAECGIRMVEKSEAFQTRMEKFMALKIAEHEDEANAESEWLRKAKLFRLS